MAGIPAGRRCTVARGANDQLVVWSPLPATRERIEELKRLGDPAAFVVASRFHDSFFADYFEAFPDTVFLAPPGPARDHASWPLVTIPPGHDLLAGFDWVEMAGMPRVQEHVFVQHDTGSLIVADMIFNVPRVGGWFDRLLLKMADIGVRPGPSRLWRTLIKDRRAFGASLEHVLSWKFDRIMPGHGECVPSGGRELLAGAFARWRIPG
jgi:hypothetical protein